MHFFTARTVFVAVYAAFILFAAGWIVIAGLPAQNALELAAEGKLSIWHVWGYHFRLADLLDKNENPGWLLGPVRIFSAQWWWIFLLLLHSVLLARASRWLRLFMAALSSLAVIVAPMALLWLVALSALSSLRAALRPQYTLVGRIFLFAAAVFSLLYTIPGAVVLANPTHAVNRQRVLGGKSYRDEWKISGRPAPISLNESCIAVINPDDLRGVEVLEKLSRESLRRFSRVILLDLKVVTENYRLLLLRNEKGDYLFSDAARTFAAAERRLAERVLPDVLAAPEICLIAAFDRQPGTETAPFSRSRFIIEQRQKGGKPTRVIQVSAN